MKIGIVSIGNDSMELWKFLHKYDHEYVVYYDADARPLGDKTRDRQLEIVQEGYDRLAAEGCEAIILPPVGEVARMKKDEEGRVLPLYRSYVMQAFGKSLVGKIGYLAESGQYTRMKNGEEGEMRNMMQEGLHQWASEYQRSEAQLQTKQFQRPMAWRGRDVRQWKYFLRSLSPRSYLINKVVKFDLRYLKDADVDTVLPTEWSHLAMEKTIARFFNPKRTRWHGLQVLEGCFKRIIEEQERVGRNKQVERYAVTVLYRGDRDMLESSQKYSWLMGRGKQTPITYREVD